MSVPGSWSSLLRDRYNATILSSPVRTVVPRWKKFFNGARAAHHRGRMSESRRDRKREIGGSVEGMENARDCTSLERTSN